MFNESFYWNRILVFRGCRWSEHNKQTNKKTTPGISYKNKFLLFTIGNILQVGTCPRTTTWNQNITTVYCVFITELKINSPLSFRSQFGIFLSSPFLFTASAPGFHDTDHDQGYQDPHPEFHCHGLPSGFGLRENTTGTLNTCTRFEPVPSRFNGLLSNC